jgi:UDP-N-acetylmuramoyl-L-alanyl-D-glutamate--2,6-diaminopimelate ligase
MTLAALRDRGPGMRLDELAVQMPIPSSIVGDPSVRVFGVKHDSRLVEPGDLFVAQLGAHRDGAKFIDDAVRRGAVAVVTSSPPVGEEAMAVPLVITADTRSGLARASQLVYGEPSRLLDVVGITGTNGKTTTTYLARAAIDGALGRDACGVMGTVGYSFARWKADAAHTTPEADEIARLLAHMTKLGATHVAMEVSSHALALERVQGIRFRVAALTNLTQDHLDFHGSMRAYADAKARLFLDSAPEAVVVNVGDEFGREVARRTSAAVVRVAARRDVEGKADVFPLQAIVDASGVRAIVRTPQGEVDVASPLVGNHNLDNVLLTLGIVHALGLDLRRAATALSHESGPPGRLERCDTPPDDIIVLVDYAHTPDALKQVLAGVRPIARGRLWCVFGCGGDRDSSKRSAMGEVAVRGADAVVITSDNPRSEDERAIADAILGGALTAGGHPHVELDRGRAIEFAIAGASKGDVVVIAGKGHETHQVIRDVRRIFDDRVEARQALARRRARGDA